MLTISAKRSQVLGRSISLALFACLLCVLLSTAQAQESPSFRYAIGAGFSLNNLSGSASPIYPLSPGYELSLSLKLSRRFSAQVDFLYSQIYSDSTASSAWSLGSDLANRTSAFRARRGSLTLTFHPLGQSSRLAPLLGAGFGVNYWRMLDGSGLVALDTLGASGVRTVFRAEELIVSVYGGLDLSVSQRLALRLGLRSDYHAGPGADFADIVNDFRPRMLHSLSVALRLRFGGINESPRWSSEKSWRDVDEGATGRTRRVRDSDNDGISDKEDKCPGTPRGADVNSIGCPLDSDGDGVFDGLDDCPATPSSALGLVDISGCPIDSDFDGIPDFRDACADNPPGAHVDGRGCPLDSDGDGVSDGLDDCPDSRPGIAVDKYGCIDLAVFDKTMILNIAYVSGSYEVDRASEARLRDLAEMLMAASEVTLDIYGYSDNIGPAKANRKLSKKRANRVRDYLLRHGVAKPRMRAIGRGETNFVADNATRKGRQLNRRIEIVFKSRN